uniref:CCHC-type domain-containing protein n=1 Tax=Brassica oleracea var. oleracea TaxID=109376 RepID=A0A0D3DNX8_BRAOL
MANIEKLQFPVLKITGENYVGWVTNVKPYLVMKKITKTIVIGNKSPPEHIAEAIIFLKKHLDENLTHDYANVEDPAELWQSLSTNSFTSCPKFTENAAKAFPEVNATAVENSERRNQTNRGKRNSRGYHPEAWDSVLQSVCYRCGCKGHWSRTCRTPPHLCKLYQESTKGKAKEVNLTENFEGTSYLDASDFAYELD